MYNTTRNWPLQSNRFAGVYPLLVYICFPVGYEGNNKGATSTRRTGALRTLWLLFPSDHAGKQVYTNNGYTPANLLP
jgi:hypothetical protein